MRRFRASALASVLAAVVAFVLLIPSGGADTDPPECWSVFGYVVPCGFGPEQSHGAGFAFAGAVLASALVGLGSAVGRWERGRDRHDRTGGS